VLRGDKQLTLAIPVTEHQESVDDLNDVPDLQRTLIPKLGVFVTDLDGALKPLLHESDVDSGVVVIAQAGGSNVINTGVESGDMIHAINRTQLESVSQLQSAVHQLKSGSAVVLQIERQGKLQYLAFEID
jgi:serine protease Do